MTEYIILKADDENQHFNVEAVGVVASSSRRALVAAKVGAGTYIAVPERSWHPLTVKVEQTTKVTIS